MATPHRKVLDISHWNNVTSWSSVRQAGIVGIIAKATEGDYYTDPNFAGTREACRQQGLSFGAYHFATDDPVQAQVERFLRVTGLDAQFLYALDWEDYGSNTMSLEQAREFLRLLDAQIGLNRSVLYSGNTAKEALGSRSDPFFSAHRLWLAQYGSNPVPQLSWPTWWLWQYSDGVNGPSPHGCPGVSGDVDTNSWEGTDSELKKQWSGSSAAPPPAERPRVDVNATGAVDIYVNGRIVES